jgi:glutathione peroxidase
MRLAHVFAIVAIAAALTAFAGDSTSAPPTTQPQSSPLGFAVKDIDGKPVDLAQYRGNVVLMVNVASRCGYTKQYKGLEELYEKYKDRGLVVIGFPANNFGGQEPGTDEEIAEFCDTNYHVTFPVLSKISVAGDDQHPLYSALTSEIPTADGNEAMRERFRGFNMTPNEDPDIVWNFEKFLIARDGSVAARFAPATTPDDPKLVTAIETELAR